MLFFSFTVIQLRDMISCRKFNSVGTYIERCISGGSAIVSLRREGFRCAMLEIDPRRNVLVQAAVQRKRRIRADEQAIIAKWMLAAGAQSLTNTEINPHLDHRFSLPEIQATSDEFDGQLHVRYNWRRLCLADCDEDQAAMQKTRTGQQRDEDR